MQTRYVAVCDKLGRPLKTYPIAIAHSNYGTQDADFAREALERAKVDRLVPEGVWRWKLPAFVPTAATEATRNETV